MANILSPNEYLYKVVITEVNEKEYVHFFTTRYGARNFAHEAQSFDITSMVKVYRIEDDMRAVLVSFST